MMKWALLGGAALAVSASGAYADDLAALKAELAALKSRVNQLEAQPAPAALPEGYSLLSVSRGSNVSAPIAMRKEDRIEQGKGFTISVLPAADAAPTTEVTVQGEIRTQLRYIDEDFDWFGLGLAGATTCPPAAAHCEIHNDNLDVLTRARLNVTGKTETAVGEVGVFIRVQGDGLHPGNGATIHTAYGWWKMAPNWTLTAGFLDTTAAVQAGVDWDFNFSGTFAGISNQNVDQMRLTYDSGGPISVALAVESPDFARTIGTGQGGVPAFTGGDQSDLPGLSGYVMYNADNIMFQVTGHVEDDDTPTADTDWFIGGGTRIGLGDVLTFTAAAGYGEGYSIVAENAGFFQADNAVTGPKFGIGADDEFWGVSAGIIANLSDDLSAEVGGAYGENDGNPFGDFEGWGVTGGLYWKPVSQLKIGVNASYSETDGRENNNFDAHRWEDEIFIARFVTWMSF
jgi:hypothetical protein